MDGVRSVTATFDLNSYELRVIPSGSGSGLVESVDGGVNCGTDCTENYDHGTMVTLLATASTGSTFTGWSGGGCSGTTTFCTVTMDMIQFVSADFTIDTNTLTVNKTGAGAGTVVSDPGGISCGETCSTTYDFGEVVTLTAVPETGSSFSGWSGGGCTGTGTCVVTMDAARSVTATFGLETHTITVEKSGDGTGTVTASTGGINCGATCMADYEFGTMVTFTASATAGSTFAGWGGACASAGASSTCMVSISMAATVSATFTLGSDVLSVSKAGNGDGTITSTPAGIDCGSTCATSFTNGTEVTLVANPSPGSIFTGWSGACSGSGDCTVTVSSAVSVHGHLRAGPLQRHRREDRRRIGHRQLDPRGHHLRQRL